MVHLYFSSAESKRYGFTLIELSIVLVIVGLIIGSILVGRDLIKAAQVRSIISQLDKFASAVNIFRMKYTYFPGDMPPSAAAQFGFFQLSGAGLGNNNGLVEGFCMTESLVFWRHLSEASLVEGGPYGSTGNYTINPATGTVTADVTSGYERSMPASKKGGNYMASCCGLDQFANANYLALFKPTSIFAAGFCGINSALLTPTELYGIETKMDDGIPRVGRITYIGSWAAAPTVGMCLSGGTGVLDPANIYNTTGTGTDVPACGFNWIYSK